MTPCALHAWRQLRERRVDVVLHQRQRVFEVGADLEGDRQRVAAVAAAGRRHVHRPLDAVDRLLDRDADRLGHHLRAGAGIAGRHLDGRRRDLRILRDRQADDAHRAQDDRDDGDDVGEDRMLDEELGHPWRPRRQPPAAV